MIRKGYEEFSPELSSWISETTRCKLKYALCSYAKEISLDEVFNLFTRYKKRDSEKDLTFKDYIEKYFPKEKYKII